MPSSRQCKMTTHLPVVVLWASLDLARRQFTAPVGSANIEIGCVRACVRACVRVCVCVWWCVYSCPVLVGAVVAEWCVTIFACSGSRSTWRRGGRKDGGGLFDLKQDHVSYHARAKLQTPRPHAPAHPPEAAVEPPPRVEVGER
jgi:hypothetical protein